MKAKQTTNLIAVMKDIRKGLRTPSDTDTNSKTLEAASLQHSLLEVVLESSSQFLELH